MKNKESPFIIIINLKILKILARKKHNQDSDALT